MTMLAAQRHELQQQVGEDGKVAHMGNGYGGTKWEIRCKKCWHLPPKGAFPGARLIIMGKDAAEAWTRWVEHLPNHQ